MSRRRPDGDERDGLHRAGAPAVLGLVYTCLPATVLGSGLWTWLPTRYPAGSVAN